MGEEESPTNYNKKQKKKEQRTHVGRYSTAHTSKQHDRYGRPEHH